MKITNQPMNNSSNARIILIDFMIYCLVLIEVYLLIRKSIFLCYSFFGFCVKQLCFLLFNLHKIKGSYVPRTSRKKSS